MSIKHFVPVSPLSPAILLHRVFFKILPFLVEILILSLKKRNINKCSAPFILFYLYSTLQDGLNALQIAANEGSMSVLKVLIEADFAKVSVDKVGLSSWCSKIINNY